jgi:hypothetical protein
MWCTFQIVILEILLDSFGDAWLGIVGVYRQFPTIFCTTKSAYFRKNVINIALAGPLLSFRQKRYEVESMVWEPDLFVLIQKIKPDLIQGYKTFPALVLD